MYLIYKNIGIAHPFHSIRCYRMEKDKHKIGLVYKENLTQIKKNTNITNLEITYLQCPKACTEFKFNIKVDMGKGCQSPLQISSGSNKSNTNPKIIFTRTEQIHVISTHNRPIDSGSSCISMINTIGIEEK